MSGCALLAQLNRERQEVDPLTEIERLIAIEAIKALIARRARALDTRDWDTYARCHAPSVVSTSGLFDSNLSRDEMIRANQDLVSNLETMIHCVHSPNITILSAVEAKGHSFLENWDFWKQDGEEHWYHGWGYYDETFGIHDGKWVFTARKLTWLRQEFSEGAAGPTVDGLRAMQATHT